MSRLAKKEAYDARLCGYLDEYNRAFLVSADNVGSKQFADIRKALRPGAVVCMGKNTMMKRSIRLYVERTGNDKWAPLLEMLVGNVGIVFTNEDLMDVREEIAKYKVGAPARVGAIAPLDVIVPAGGTGLDPAQTSFFQVLNIPTKINKGTVEILNDTHVIFKDQKVGSSEAALLGKLNIRPFSYGLEIAQVFDNGSWFDPKVLDITDDDMEGAFMAGLRRVTAVSLETGYGTVAAVPHCIINGYKKVLAIALETEYSFPLAQKIKDLLANPEALAAMAAAAAAPAAGGGGAAAAAPEPEEEEEEEDMGFDLFD